MSKKNRPLCGSENTHDGKPCRLYKDTCRYESHKYPKVKTAAAISTPAIYETTAELSTFSDDGLSIPDLLDTYVSDTEHGIHTNIEDFVKAMGQARKVYPSDISPRNIIRDMYMMSGLWGLAQRYPGGIVNVKNPRHPKVGEEYIDTGMLIFVGGTALSAAHGTTQRYSQDLDFLYVPNLRGTAKDNILKRRHDIIKAAAKGGVFSRTLVSRF